jgi:thiol-disulfide isomerase/thioredoxin
MTSSTNDVPGHPIHFSSEVTGAILVALINRRQSLSPIAQLWSNEGMHKALAFVLALFLSCTALAQSVPSEAHLACRWSAQLTVFLPDGSDSYQVPFDLLIERTPNGLNASLLNGSDRMRFSSVVQQGSAVTLRLEQYDATLSAHCTPGTSCRTLEGEYVREKGLSSSRFQFSAKCARPAAKSMHAAGSAVASNWQFVFRDPRKPGSEKKLPGRFTQEGRHFEGTIAPISGDYGMLSGDISEGEDASLHLSRFDGIHTLRLDGHFVSPERIEGVLHAGPGTALAFVATRTASGAEGFAEAEHLTTVENPAGAFRFHGVDAAGNVVTQDDARFRGKVVLVDIFGTWCPNCHDEAPVLQGLYTKFHARGLEIVGLSFEYVDDRARNLRLLDIYRKKYSIGFPLLLTGTTDAGQIAATLPQLRNFGAYPTTIFLDRHGRVRLIHAGFSGPATGRLDEVKRDFERNIAKLLDEQ